MITVMEGDKPLKLLVIGAEGNLGQTLIQAIQTQRPNDQVVATFQHELDFTQDPSAIDQTLNALNPDVIVNTAAYTNVDKSETETQLAHTVNAVGPQRLAEWVETHQRFLVHISTDYVFDGNRNTPYTKTDTPNPINAYGQTKLDGEIAVLKTAPERSVILRTSWLFGPAKMGFVWYVISGLQAQKDLNIFQDQTGTPTWTGNLTQMIFESIDRRMTGVTHATSKGLTTRWDQACYICQQMGGDAELLKPILTESLHLPAKRPLYTAMTPDYDSALDWQQATDRFLSQQGLTLVHV